MTIPLSFKHVGFLLLNVDYQPNSKKMKYFDVEFIGVWKPLVIKFTKQNGMMTRVVMVNQIINTNHCAHIKKTWQGHDYVCPIKALLTLCSNYVTKNSVIPNNLWTLNNITNIQIRKINVRIQLATLCEHLNIIWCFWYGTYNTPPKRFWLDNSNLPL